ncbi:recombinase family protein [Youxingia wuxianensis]|uniref:Recombinase family protein n=1 Tax=Youxingia wuxianensis TaxID=2763678 RepID=A0A926EM65_9FIRM|nr:recombinase family protein [Youxingia wuxianensis]MBC8584453.1 recombinase family protein [Youxingia wuxianensis]
MDTAIYLRKSRAEEYSQPQEETLAMHKEILLSYAGNHNLNITGVYEEVVSGESLFSRPQMLKLLEAVQNHTYAAVLCMDIDRLGRGGMKDQGIILDAFKYSGTKIITPEKTYDLSDELDEELTEFKTFLSRRELKMINKRLNRGLRQTIKNGGYVSNAPYGYCKIRKDKLPSLEIVEEEANFVRMMFDLYLQGEGCSAIAQTVNALGAKPRRCDAFSRNSVMHILKNPVYIGQVVWERTQHVRQNGSSTKHVVSCAPKDWLCVRGVHPSIVSPETFARVQNRIHSRTVPAHNDGTIKNPLAGLVTCGVCGRVLQRRGAHQSSPYLLCPTPGCVCGSKFSLVLKEIEAVLKPILSAIPLELYPLEGKDTSLLELSLAQSQKQLMSFSSQRITLYSLLEQGVYDIATFQERMSALNENIRCTKMRAAVQEQRLRRMREESIPLEMKKIKSVQDVYRILNAGDKNLLLKCFIEKIMYTKPKGAAPQQFCLEIHLKPF